MIRVLSYLHSFIHKSYIKKLSYRHKIHPLHSFGLTAKRLRVRFPDQPEWVSVCLYVSTVTVSGCPSGFSLSF